MLDAISHRQFYGDKERTFCLSLPMVRELERVTGRGIGGLTKSMFAREFNSIEVFEVIRLALIGGGEEPEAARGLIEAYAHPRPIGESYALCLDVLDALMSGAAKAENVQYIAQSEADDTVNDGTEGLVIF